MIGLEATLLDIGITGLPKHDSPMTRAALSKQEVEQWTDYHWYRHEPNDKQPEDLARQGMLILKEHVCDYQVTNERKQDNHEKQKRVGYTASIF
jgi:hypothetical protein